MNETIGSHQVSDLPAERRAVLDFSDLSSWDHRMYGLLEVDVTVPRQYMAAYQARTGERLSFTGYLAYCLAQAVAENKSVQAYRQGRSQLVLFDDVDIGMMIEREIGGRRAPDGYVLRRANRKSFLEIHQEIRTVQRTPPATEGGPPRWVRWLQVLPWPFSKLAGALMRSAIRRDPARTWVAQVGTVGLSAVGMFGKRGGWPLAAPAGHTLCLFVGGIARKPACVGDCIEPREILNLTVTFHHDVVDGGPAARFAARLVELIEGGAGLKIDT